MDGLEPGQIDRRHHKGGHLPDHRSDGSTLYPHMKNKDKDRVQNHVKDRADDHGKHGVFGAAIRTDHGIDGGRYHHKRQTEANDEAILQGQRPQQVGCAEEGQDRVDEQQEHHSQDDADHGHQGNRVAHALLGHVHLALTQLQAQKGRAAVADHHSQCQGNDGDGKHHIGGAVAQVAYAPADKDLVYDVVQGIDQQGNDAGNGKFQDQPANGLRGKGTLALWYFFFHLDLHSF